MYNGIQTSAGVIMDIAVNKEVISGKADFIITLDPCTIFGVNSKYDSSIAPRGHHLLSAWMPIDSTRSKSTYYIHGKFKELEQNMHKVFSADLNNGSPTIIRKIAFGTAFGFYPSRSMTRSKRPVVSFPTVANLYLVGNLTNAVGIGGSSDIAFNSAMECHKAIISKAIELNA
jgi:phytoene dehydrogenase-like protein